MDAPKNFKLLTLAFVSMFCVTLAPAINALDLGLKAGFSLSDQSYNYTQINFNIDRLRQTGFVAGAFVEQNLGQLTSIRLEVDYVQKGSALEFDSTSEFSPTILGTIRLEDQIDYLSLSLLATPSLLNLQVISPYLIAGPRIDVLLSSDTEVEKVARKDLESTVFGASVGAGIKLSVSPAASLFVEGVYQPDISDAFKFPTLNIKNNSFLISAGLSF